MIIAIDGFSACGKSTLAKQLADSLSFVYIDTGAMYRAATLYFIENQIDYNREEAVEEGLKNVNIVFKRINNSNVTFLNEIDVESAIRSMRVAQHVSNVAAIPAVRHAMVAIQREVGELHSVVMDGRDIGTVVFPNARLKLFLTASLQKRVERRYFELLNKGKSISKEEIQANLTERDHIDSTRAHSPLRQAEDAVVIDNTNLSIEEQFEMTLTLAKLRST
ncbi:MAG: (d)CMP kinase [Bacteroidota bacterium]